MQTAKKNLLLNKFTILFFIIFLISIFIYHLKGSITAILIFYYLFYIIIGAMIVEPLNFIFVTCGSWLIPLISLTCLIFCVYHTYKIRGSIQALSSIENQKSKSENTLYICKNNKTQSLINKFAMYEKMIRMFDDYVPKMKKRHRRAIYILCTALPLLSILSAFSEDLDVKYAFFGGAFLALIYKLMDNMNNNIKTAFDKRMSYIDKLIDINQELQEKGESAKKYEQKIDELINKTIKNN